jgi:hypothetical protein
MGEGPGGNVPACFGYFSTRESTARPGEGQTEEYAKACDKGARAGRRGRRPLQIAGSLAGKARATSEKIRKILR